MNTDLLISMNDVTRMEVLGGSKQLVQDVLLMDFFQNIASLYHVVEVRI